ncbi:uncharacterized protein LOC122572356 [Bombus pyrosoma]|uniref:uncharacterized protein LOC122572356 n=1 Tax=Bombus pyrosoma TaxID=396416 RepID=UPI001CB97E6E|nr:uncharacterized protein LOC122572356 [Bombus pyrosoma]
MEEISQIFYALPSREFIGSHQSTVATLHTRKSFTVTGKRFSPFFSRTDSISAGRTDKSSCPQFKQRTFKNLRRFVLALCVKHCSDTFINTTEFILQLWSHFIGIIIGITSRSHRMNNFRSVELKICIKQYRRTSVKFNGRNLEVKYKLKLYKLCTIVGRNESFISEKHYGQIPIRSGNYYDSSIFL